MYYGFPKHSVIIYVYLTTTKYLKRKRRDNIAFSSLLAQFNHNLLDVIRDFVPWRYVVVLQTAVWQETDLLILKVQYKLYGY
jgi:hypothetical protein